MVLVDSDTGEERVVGDLLHSKFGSARLLEILPPHKSFTGAIVVKQLKGGALRQCDPAECSTKFVNRINAIRRYK